MAAGKRGQGPQRARSPKPQSNRPKAAPRASAEPAARTASPPAASTPGAAGRSTTTARRAQPRERATLTDWLSFALICGSSVFCALLELMFIPLYIGSFLVPITVVAAIVSNAVLPWWGYRTIGRGLGAVVPVLLWLVTLLGLSVVQRPEGDLFVSGAYHQSWAYYGVILLGAIAGFTTVLSHRAHSTEVNNSWTRWRTGDHTRVTKHR